MLNGILAQAMAKAIVPLFAAFLGAVGAYIATDYPAWHRAFCERGN